MPLYVAAGAALPEWREQWRRAGDPVRTRHEGMLEAAIWIGIVLCGIAVLGVAEYLRAKRIVRFNGDAIKSVLPIAALLLLLSIAAGMAVLFFFLFFLSDYWEYALIFGGLLFAFLVVRIRREQSFFAPASQVDLAGPEPDAKKSPGPGPGIALQIGTVAAMLVMMIPVLTGAFLIFMFLNFIAEKIVGGWPVLLPILAVISVATYFIIRNRASPSS